MSKHHTLVLAQQKAMQEELIKLRIEKNIISEEQKEKLLKEFYYFVIREGSGMIREDDIVQFLERTEFLK